MQAGILVLSRKDIYRNGGGVEGCRGGVVWVALSSEFTKMPRDVDVVATGNSRALANLKCLGCIWWAGRVRHCDSGPIYDSSKTFMEYFVGSSSEPHNSPD